jgi:hypothetical protein
MFMIESRNVFKINPVDVNINTASIIFSFQFEMDIETHDKFERKIIVFYFQHFPKSMGVQLSNK